MPICCIRLLWDWWFHLGHRIVCTCYFVASYLPSLWYDWFFIIIIINIIIIIICSHLRVFHTSISWWSFTGVWVTTSLLKSPGLFSVFWQIFIMQLFGSPFILLFPSPTSLELIFWWLTQEHQLQLVLSSLSGYTAFSNPLQGRSTYPSFHILLISHIGPLGQQSPQFCKFSFLLFIIIKSGCLTEIW